MLFLLLSLPYEASNSYLIYVETIEGFAKQNFPKNVLKICLLKSYKVDR